MKHLPSRRMALALAGVSVLALAACGDDNSFDPQSQVGSNPNLPEQNQYLFPPMHLAKVVGWKEGETPTVPAGFKIEALATGLQHPRSLYVLPNGDILVVESKSPALDPITLPELKENLAAPRYEDFEVRAMQQPAMGEAA